MYTRLRTHKKMFSIRLTRSVLCVFVNSTMKICDTDGVPFIDLTAARCHPFTLTHSTDRMRSVRDIFCGEL